MMWEISILSSFVLENYPIIDLTFFNNSSMFWNVLHDLIYILYILYMIYREGGNLYNYNNNDNNMYNYFCTYFCNNTSIQVQV